MNWRWLFLDFVPPEIPLSTRERREVRRRAQKLLKEMAARHPFNPFVVLRSWLPLIAVLLAILSPTVLLFAQHWVNMAVFNDPTPSMSVMLAEFAFMAVLMWVISSFVGALLWRPHVLEAVREQGFELCPKCGYWLRDLPDETTKCPECGAKRAQSNEPESSR